MAEELVFRKVEKADLPRISQFRKAFWEAQETGRSSEPEYYEWKCFKNTYQPGEMWLAEDGDTVVGMKSMVPRRMKVLGAEAAGAETGDTFTHPGYQRRGIFTGLFEAAKRHRGLDTRLDFIYGLPNEISLLGYERKLDYAQVPVKVRSLALPLNPRLVLQTKVPAFLAAILSPAVRLFYRTAFKIGTRSSVKSEVKLGIEPAFPEDIGAVWEQVSRNYDVSVVRDKSYLEWRYVTNPDAYSIFIARDGGGASLGYLVTRFHGGTLPTGYVCDFLTLENDPDIFRALLAGAVADFSKKGAALALAYAVKGGFYDRLMRRAGFLPRAGHIIITYNSELGRRVLSGNYRWHFTMGDSDHV
jgi:GNAT superfamily N-acetyltransferase